MDPFTQRMLEKAEQRSRALGICNADASKFPLGEANSPSLIAANKSTGSSSGSGGGDADCATTMVVASPQQQHKQQLPLPTNKSGCNNSSNNKSGGNINKLQVIEKTTMDSMGTNSQAGSSKKAASSPGKILRQFSAVDKENVDLGIEINIMTDKHVEVQVQVEEQEISDEDGKHQVIKGSNFTEGTHQSVTQPTAKIRDTSRNRLQRLGALYSEKDDLSSPIHRTEGHFNAEGKDINELEAQLRKPKQRLGKLAALASTINQWEDDTSNHISHQLQTECAQSSSSSAIKSAHTISGSGEAAAIKSSHTKSNSGEANCRKTKSPPPKPDLPSRGRIRAESHTKGQAPQPPGRSTKDADSKTKQLKWDPKVLNSLEAQGFQRRDSSTVKVTYDFKCAENDNTEKQTQEESKNEEKRLVGKLNIDRFEQAKLTNEVTTSSQPEKTAPTVKTGLVSGRAAIFESQAQANLQQQKPQKDPTELSLKERMKLFERNKGEALVPKAAFGMAAPISKIQQDANNKKEDHTKATGNASNVNITKSETAHPPLVKADNKLRDKVAAIFSSKNANTIKEEIRKQREEDMQLLANRFNKQKKVFDQNQKEQQDKAKEEETSLLAPQPQKLGASARIAMNATTKSPRPPPPPIPSAAANTNISTKRRSPGNDIDDFDSKCAPPKRIYPALSDLESVEFSSINENNCTTATVSGRSTPDEVRNASTQLLRGHQHANTEQDEDNADSYMESETEDSSVGICNGSLGREIMQVVQKNDKQQLTKIKEVRYADNNQYFGDGTLDSSMNSESEASMGVDDYLDEALDENEDGDDDITQDEDDENNSRLSRNSKGTTASNSFSFRKATTPNKFTNCLTINEESEVNHQSSTTESSAVPTQMQPVTSEFSLNKENENIVTLVHTVSFYRRQQSANSANSTPIRKICREQQVLRSAIEKLESKGVPADMVAQHHGNDSFGTDDETQSESDQDDAHLVQEKIKKLLEEVCKQQQVIAQTSQALNLCAATIEFSGSTESVEGERHLLVATHRRQACLDEVQRLRVEKSLRPLGAPREKGRLTVKEITVPLRQDYIRKLASDTISGHHLVCLLKYNEHVLATRTVPTLPGLLAVKFPDVLQLNNVYADFKVTLEIYGMTAQREVLPHEVKYHINLNKKANVKTPKKKGADNRLVMPPVQSPAGPHVVRTPALVQYGFAIFSLREIQRTTWTLTQVLGVSPLDGAVHMKVNCELSVSVEYKGFLTMFEDISGFGAWHRRWCHLNGTMLNYWKYPDDEKKKTPMGSIDLYTCSSQKVNTAPRDICARLHTMLLECQRPALDSDEESLVIVPNGRTTTVRYLLSADTKEEREEWCAYFNKALTLLRAWGPPQ